MKKLLLLIIISILNIANLTANIDKWENISDHLEAFEYVPCFAISNGNVFAGHLWGLILLSTNNGVSWDIKYKDAFYKPIRSIAISGDRVIAGLDSFGVVLSTDYGNTWAIKNNGLTNDSVQAIAIDGNNIFICTRGGIFLSTDNGDNWIAKNSGFSNLNILSIAISGKNIFVGTNDGIYLSTDNGSKWVLKTSDYTGYQIAINGDDIYAVAGGIFLSTDNGDTWADKSNSFENKYFYSITNIGNNIFAGSCADYINMRDGVIVLSTDKGDTWKAVYSEYSGDITLETNVGDLVIDQDKIYALIGERIYRANLIDFGIVDVEDNNISDNFKLGISPNPAGDYISISLNKGLQPFIQSSEKVLIYNCIGEIVISLDAINLTKIRIDISQLYTGLCFVRYGDEIGKFVKE